MDITVVICTYDGASRLPNVFNRLADQVFTADIAWNILVVDNNSQDQTAQVVRQYQGQPDFADKLQYAFEPKQGLAFARRCAVQAASGELLAFLDDDNLPDLGWVQAVYEFGQQHPEAGAYGSQIIGGYEVDPPPDFERIACFLAVIDRGSQPFRYDLLDRWLFPAGAGLVVRRRAWLTAVPRQPKLSGVSAQALTGKGEDIETLSYLRKAGWPIWHNPKMQIEHMIGRDRMTPGYLLALFQGVGLSRYHTRMVRFRPWQQPLAVVAYGLNDLRCWLQYYMTHFSQRSSIVIQCELTLRYYSLLSPFYSFFQRLANLIDQVWAAGWSVAQVDSS
ncbi:MAG: glycosyltransferase family 2 protein [Leptolyngbya sp. SIO4C1]|nr:glycosyltransferase family 2 protein [Leptolyngbya sp. SIO4C1]